VESDNPRIEEQILSQLVAKQLTNQFDEVDALAVDIQTDLFKVIQGQADAVTIEGQGLEINQDIRIEELRVHTNQVALNPLRALFSQLELSEPIDAQAQIGLTEADLNQILNSDYLDRLPPWRLKLADQIVSIQLQRPVQLRLPDDRRIMLNGSAAIWGPDDQQMTFAAIVHPRTAQQSVPLVEAFHCQNGAAIPLDLVLPLLQHVQELIQAPYLEWQGTLVQIKEFRIQKGRLTIQLDTRVKAGIRDL
jgi:hypothetical protein